MTSPFGEVAFFSKEGCISFSPGTHLMRKPRIKLVGTTAVYHCIGRLIREVGKLGREDLEVLRKLLWKQARFCGVQILTYCLMGNHFHVLVRVPDRVILTDRELLEKLRGFYGAQSPQFLMLEESFQKNGELPENQRQALLSRMGDLSVFMKEFKQRFTRYYNALHERSGTLWAERFRSILIEDHSRSLKIVALYIDLNPLRANITEDPTQYRFCGIAQALGGSTEAREGLLSCWNGSEDWEVESRAYLKALYIQSADPGHSKKKALSRERILEKLRNGDPLPLQEVLRLHIRYFIDGLVLGSHPYVEQVFQSFPDHFGPKRKTGARKPSALGLALGDLRVARDLKVRAVE